MSIRFSKVTATAFDESAEFLVSGVPQSREDLDRWAAFHDFTDGLPTNANINVTVETFIYGDGEVFDACVEEIASFYRRIERNPEFIEDCTEKVSESGFEIIGSSDMTASLMAMFRRSGIAL